MWTNNKFSFTSQEAEKQFYQTYKPEEQLTATTIEALKKDPAFEVEPLKEIKMDYDEAINEEEPIFLDSNAFHDSSIQTLTVSSDKFYFVTDGVFDALENLLKIVELKETPEEEKGKVIQRAKTILEQYGR